MDRDPLIFIIAGEPSGDRIGAEIIQSITRKRNGKVRFAGVGGSHMAQEGLTSIFPLSDLTLMGIIEIIPKLPTLLRRFNQTLEAILGVNPDLVLTIDCPDFCLRVSQKAKKMGYPVIHYTAPTVWAWRPGRAKKIARFLDHLLLLYKFEKKYFDEVHLPNTFVGHPLCYAQISKRKIAPFLKKYKIASTTPLVCVLPGSRRSEVIYLMPIYYQAIKKILEKHPKTHFILPIAPTVKDIIVGALEGWDLPITLVEGEEDKYAAMNASKVAIAASGTVTLELAMAKLPMVITYIMHPITAWLGRLLIRTKYIGLPNIILNKLFVPELIQEKCTPEGIFKEVNKLLEKKKEHDAQVKGFEELSDARTLQDQTPSDKAADVILDFLEKRGVR